MESVVRIGAPLITNDTVVFGILMALLGGIFYATTTKACAGFFKFIPALLLCYFLPSIITTTGLISPAWFDLKGALAGLNEAGFAISMTTDLAMLKDKIASLEVPSELLDPYIHKSKLYYVASRYMLPASLILLTLSINLREVFRLGPKALIMFFTGTVGVIVGGPIAILITSTFAPEVVGGQAPEEIWRGMTTIAGSWIGGGANQAAMFEIFNTAEHPISGSLYSKMIAVDIIVAEVWMFFLLLGVGRSDALDRFFKADASNVERLKDKMHEFSQKIARIATFQDIMVILGIGLGLTGLAHLLGGGLSDFFGDLDTALIEKGEPAFYKRFSLTSSFFWLIVLATTFGIGLSFTKARNYEGAGASKIGTIFIYILVATIGMKMDILAIFDSPGIFGVGFIWMAIHVVLLVIVGKLIKAPFFYLAVGSKANIGGAASAPVVAAAFHPSLAPVGVLLAVVGYALGTYGAWLCGILMEQAAP